MRSLFFIFFILLFSVCFSQKKLNMNLHLPSDYKIIERNDKLRRKVFKNSDEIYFAISVNDKVKSNKNLSLLSALFLLKMKESVDDFSLLYDEESHISNGNQYVFYIYTYLKEGSLLYSYQYQTIYNSEMITFIFSGYEKEILKYKDSFEEIISSVSFGNKE